MSKSGVVVVLAAFVAVVAPACGRASRSSHPTGAAGGVPSNGGTSGSGGVAGLAGAGGATGGDGSSIAGNTSGTAGAEGGEGGEPGAGGTAGTATITAGTAGTGGADECSRADAPCFEPCGGDPTGNWVVEAGCVAGSDLGEGCSGGSLQGTLSDLSLRLAFYADGTLRVSGGEAWDLTASVSRACLALDGAQPCDQGVLFTNPLLFAQSRSLLACQRESCGLCECAGAVQNGPGSNLRWVTSGSRIAMEAIFNSFGIVNVPYCVEGDVMYLGGDDLSGQSRVSYKLRKRSCVQTLPPCSVRSIDECGATEDCRQGACVSAPGMDLPCELWADSQCEEMLGCVWEPNRCGPTGLPSCDFHRCEQMPGCELGPPVKRCAGNPSCGWLDASDCNNEPGCSMRSCRARGDDVTSCNSLYADWCELAPGCSFDGTNCVGNTRCSAQTDDDVCGTLFCEPETNCFGIPTRGCSELSVDECPSLGCTVEW